MRSIALGARTTLPAICNILLLQPPSWDCRIKRSLNSFSSVLTTHRYKLIELVICHYRIIDKRTYNCELYAACMRCKVTSLSASWDSKEIVCKFKDLSLSSLNFRRFINLIFSFSLIFKSLQTRYLYWSNITHDIYIHWIYFEYWSTCSCEDLIKPIWVASFACNSSIIVSALFALSSCSAAVISLAVTWKSR